VNHTQSAFYYKSITVSAVASSTNQSYDLETFVPPAGLFLASIEFTLPSGVSFGAGGFTADGNIFSDGNGTALGSQTLIFLPGQYNDFIPVLSSLAVFLTNTNSSATDVIFTLKGWSGNVALGPLLVP
jgi:hypothetical protein